MPSMRRARGDVGAGRGGAGGRRGRRREAARRGRIVEGAIRDGDGEGLAGVRNGVPPGLEERQGLGVAMAGLEVIGGAIRGFGEVNVGGPIGGGGFGEIGGAFRRVGAAIMGGIGQGGAGVGAEIGVGMGAGVGGVVGVENLGLERYGALRWDEIRRVMAGGGDVQVDEQMIEVFGGAIIRELEGEMAGQMGAGEAREMGAGEARAMGAGEDGAMGAGEDGAMGAGEDRAMGAGEARAMGNEEGRAALNEMGDGAVGAPIDVRQGEAEAAGERERAVDAGVNGAEGDDDVEIIEYDRLGQVEGRQMEFSEEGSSLTGPFSLSNWRVKNDAYTITWNLHYLSINSSYSETLWSPTYQGGARTNHTWRLKTYPRMFRENGNMAVDLLHVAFGDGDMSPNRKIRLRYHFSILNANGQAVRESGSFGMNPLECKRGYGFRGVVIFKTDVLNPQLRLIEDGNIKIKCTMWMEWDVAIADAEKREMEAELQRKQAEKLSLDLGTMLKDEIMPDVSISSPTRVFQAHKNILSARSSVFAAMFRSDMCERNLNMVNIIDFDEHLVSGMLEYMYTGKTNVMEEYASGLLQISDKYDIGLLKEACEFKIAANLTVENAACVLEMAHLYNASMLKPRVMDYINSNMDAVRRTAKFQQMTKDLPCVIAELYMSL